MAPRRDLAELAKKVIIHEKKTHHNLNKYISKGFTKHSPTFSLCYQWVDRIPREARTYSLKSTLIKYVVCPSIVRKSIAGKFIICYLNISIVGFISLIWSSQRVIMVQCLAAKFHSQITLIKQHVQGFLNNDRYMPLPSQYQYTMSMRRANNKKIVSYCTGHWMFLIFFQALKTDKQKCRAAWALKLKRSSRII